MSAPQPSIEDYYGSSSSPSAPPTSAMEMSHPNEGYYATSAPPSDMSTGMVIGNSNGQISHFNEGLYEPPANDNADNRRNFPAQDGEQQQSGLRHFLTTREGIHRVCSESAFLFSIMSFVGAMSDQPGLLIAFHWRYTRLSYAGIVFHLYEGVQYVLLSTDGADEVYEMEGSEGSCADMATPVVSTVAISLALIGLARSPKLLERIKSDGIEFNVQRAQFMCQAGAIIFATASYANYHVNCYNNTSSSIDSDSTMGPGMVFQLLVMISLSVCVMVQYNAPTQVGHAPVP